MLRLFASLQAFLMCMPFSCNVTVLAWTKKDEAEKNFHFRGFFLLFYLKKFDELPFCSQNMLKVLKVLVRICNSQEF